MTMPPFQKVESNYGKKEPCEWGCSCIIKFSHCLHFGYGKYGVIIFSIQTQMAAHGSRTEKKICEVNKFWYFL